MSGKEQPPMMDQKLCVAGCGFFGSSNTSNMCSKCWASKALLAVDSQGKKDSSSVGASASLPPLTLAKPAAMEDTTTTTTPPAAAAAKPESGSGSAADSSAAAAPLTPSAAAATTTAAAATSADAPPQAPAPISAAAPLVIAPAAPSTPSSAATSPSPLSFSAGGAGAPAIGGGAAAEEAAGAAVATAAAMAAAAEAPALPEQKNRKRCFTCSKKVGYTGIACRCNYVFCSLHRYPEQHGCTFDFKTSDRNDLKRTVIGGGQFSKVDRL